MQEATAALGLGLKGARSMSPRALSVALLMVGEGKMRRCTCYLVAPLDSRHLLIDFHASLLVVYLALIINRKLWVTNLSDRCVYI